MTFEYKVEGFDEMAKQFEGEILRVIREQWLTTIADAILELIQEELRAGKYVTLGGTPIHGFFDTGRFASTFQTEWDGITVEIGSTSVKPNPLLVEYGHAPQDTEDITDEELINWVLSKKIARGLKAKKLGKAFAEFIRNNGLSPRPAVRTAIGKAELANEKIGKEAVKKIREELKFKDE